MYHLMKWTSVLLFLSLPVLLVSAIWVGEIRFLWISIVNAMFSLFAGGLADSAYASKKAEEESNVSLTLV